MWVKYLEHDHGISAHPPPASGADDAAADAERLEAQGLDVHLAGTAIAGAEPATLAEYKEQMSELAAKLIHTEKMLVRPRWPDGWVMAGCWCFGMVWFAWCRLGAVGERRQRRGTMGFAPSQQGRQWRGITRFPLPERAESRTAQGIALTQGFPRGLPGKRGIKRRQRVFRIARNTCRERLGITPRTRQKTENAARFGQGGARFRNARHIQSTRQKLRIGLGFLQSHKCLHQGFQRRQIARPGFML